MPTLFDSPPVPAVAHAQIALEQGIDIAPNGLTYAVPQSLSDLHPGDRVIVPLGKTDKPVPGHVIEMTSLDGTATSPTPPTGTKHRIKTILSRDPLGVSLPADLIELARWIAGYYCTPLGMVFGTMLPAAVKHGIGRITQTLVSLPTPTPTLKSSAATTQTTDPSPDASTPTPKPTPKKAPTPKKITKLQKAVLQAAQQHAEADNPWVEIKHLADLAGARTVTPIKQLLGKGLLVTKRQGTFRHSPVITTQQTDSPPPDHQLTPSQQHALQRLADHVHNGFSVHLLHGVTGSGKTEVYLRIIEHLLGIRDANGDSLRHCPPSPHYADTNQPPAGAIVLVPEIALTGQTIGRFVDRFGSVAAMHSGLTAAQRNEQWRRIRNGDARIVVGARSAVFAPLPRVAVIIVDEEHDTSYKQDQLPRYHARDVAIKRGQVAQAPVVLGSATPSLESYFNATHAPDANSKNKTASKKSYHLLQLPERVAGLSLPDVKIVDMKHERRLLHRAGHVHLLSQPLEKTMHRTLNDKGQAILLLNRRGYANYIACPDHRCGWLMNCLYCDAMMVYHKNRDLPTGGMLRCHHCRAEQLLPKHCPMCAKKVTVFGMGTQRVEEEIATKFPGIRLLRMDSDTMHSARDYHDGLEAFGRGELDVLVGTQMIAKGLDFPNVRLVGVIGADASLHIPDFRAAERTFQLIAQVAGRAGRGDPKQLGTVIVQTFNPADPAIVLASQHDYETFAKREIELRKQVGLPPWSRMARIVVRDQDFEACREQAAKLAKHLRQFNQQLGLSVVIQGPVPCPIARIAGYHRQQIELTAPYPAAASMLQKLLAALRNARLLRSDNHTAVDVDPVMML